MDAIEANVIKAHEAFLKKEIILESLPVCLDIASSTFCNLKCVHCIGHGPLRKIMHVKSMSNNFDANLLDKIAEPLSVAEFLAFHGWSEPMISEAFWRLADFAEQRSAVSGRRRIHVITNGNYNLNCGGGRWGVCLAIR